MKTNDDQEVEFPEFDGDLTRDRLFEALKFDLLGPESPDEVLRQSPKTRYLVGMLAPNGTVIDAGEDEQETASGADDDGSSGGGVPAVASMESSSIGLSVVVDGSAKAIAARITWGEYHSVPAEIEVPLSEKEQEDTIGPADFGLEPEEDGADDLETSPATKTITVTNWHRSPKSREIEIDLEADSGILESEGVEVSFLKRRLGGNWVVSVFLSNVRKVLPDRRPGDAEYLYQPTMVLSGDGAPFLPRRVASDVAAADPDIASADLTYRNRLEFGVGHGVAADWTQADVGQRANEVTTQIIPSYEVAKVVPRESDALSMDLLASAEFSELEPRLSAFLDEYEAWLDAHNVDDVEQPHRAVAIDHIQAGFRSLARMRDGLTTLEDADVFSAFQFMNRAMALQRRRSVQASAVQKGTDPLSDIDIAASWRPFQLGFVLQALAGLVDPKHKDREVADLLWFPTGGGKTEAYLGLTAMTLAMRRLRNDPKLNWGAGTAVIMRYTLRLLTIQQFQRALTLVSACERLRRDDPNVWGTERFTIGLWVGQSVTPNNYTDGRAALNRLRKDKPVFDKSPYQVLFCPWCGTDLGPEHYVADDATETIAINCPNVSCDYSKANGGTGIPAVVVDEEIYRHPPSLLLATVDKFAQMPWNGKIQALFGSVERHCPRHGWISAAESHPSSHEETVELQEVVVSKAAVPLGPPELIIQDELHLISGPLGTLVGIYESVIDSLTALEDGDNRIRPKVVASTATVRRAKEQVAGLFDRDIAVFPPQGLDASDSFFAVEAPDKPGRLYVGVFGPGRSIKTTLVRTYGALLGRAKFEFDSNPSEETDAYMTLVGYFNSLRELGGAVRLIEDDVPSRLRALERRGFCERRLLYENRELTSRKSSSEISGVLKRLDRTFQNKKEKEYPVDTLLSSNMISVGVDIDRLGLMVVSAQPKTTAEYIQATSRVGRQHPGLVVQVYNWVRPRDISHYEQFRHYHETFYRHVEATSVTPFSERARDRALPGVVVAHTRLSDVSLAAESGAASFDRESQKVKDFSDFLVARAKSVAKHGDEVGDETHQQLQKLLFDWRDLTDAKNGLVYSRKGQDNNEKDPSKKKAVLMRPMEMDKAQGQWPVAGSLREVEGENPIVIIDYSDGGS